MTSSSRRGERAARLVHYRLTPRLIDALYGPSAEPAQPYFDAETARRSVSPTAPPRSAKAENTIRPMGIRSPARAEVVGSLLRPPELLAAVEERSDPIHLGEIADAAVERVVRRQADIGLDVVSDGEFRRWMFLNSFYDAVEGVATDRSAVEFRNERGETVVLMVPSIEERLRPVDSPAAREAAFLAGLTDTPFKITFPAASIFAHPFGVSPEAYATHDEFVEHAIAIERKLIADAVAAGCRYVQLDFPLYPYLVDAGWSARFEEAGHSVAALFEKALAADRAVLEGLPDDVTAGLHICRGNYRSRWICEGSLEPVAERMFGELPYDVFLVEWDDVGREGGYEPIRFTPEARVVVMGLVSSKRRELEREDDLLRRLEEAAQHLPIEQLALSTQCGFASVMEGNEIDEESQWRKLELVARVADRVWS
jgi:5-methyltetrahydropteroyltriglutamate--homocysteine methyltransferase